MAYKQPPNAERKRRTAAMNSRMAQAADGVAPALSKKRVTKSDAQFLSDATLRLHGIAISLDSRDLSALAESPEFIEARELTNRIRASLLRWTKGGGE